MAKVYFITALILGQALVFVDGQTSGSSISSSSVSQSGSTTSTTSASFSSMSTSSTSSTSNDVTSFTSPSSSTTIIIIILSTTPSSSSNSISTATSTSSVVSTTTTTSTPSSVPTTSTPLGASTSTTTSTPSGASTSTTTSTPSGVPTTTTTSISSSLSTTSTNSISSSLSTTTTTTTTSTSSSTTTPAPPTTTTTSVSSSVAPPTPGTVVILCLYIKLSSCNSNEYGNVSSPQTQVLFGNVSTNLRNIYKEGQTEFIGLLDLQSSACSSNIYVVFYIKVTFIRGIFPSGVTIVNVFTTNIADGLLGNLPVSSTQYNITFQGVTITRSVKDGECQSVCCGAGGPITFVEQCTSGVCEGFQDKETMEAGHCDGGANDACKNVDCDKDGSGASSRYAPSFALLMLVTAASFLKLRV